VANNVTQAGSGLDVDTNVATLLDRSGYTQSLPVMTKDELAGRIYDHLLSLRGERQIANT
jgi:phosphopantothenoylcysteine decarboxylase/phosphopantothenate--cysteine ligase